MRHINADIRDYRFPANPEDPNSPLLTLSQNCAMLEAGFPDPITGELFQVAYPFFFVEGPFWAPFPEFAGRESPSVPDRDLHVPQAGGPLKRHHQHGEQRSHMPYPRSSPSDLEPENLLDHAGTDVGLHVEAEHSSARKPVAFVRGMAWGMARNRNGPRIASGGRFTFGMLAGEEGIRTFDLLIQGLPTFLPIVGAI